MSYNLAVELFRIGFLTVQDAEELRYDYRSHSESTCIQHSHSACVIFLDVCLDYWVTSSLCILASREITQSSTHAVYNAVNWWMRREFQHEAESQTRSCQKHSCGNANQYRRSSIETRASHRSANVR